MNVGVLGTGSVGRTLSAAMASQGHDVVVGTRDVVVREERDDEFVEWQEDNPAIKVGSFADAAAWGELLFNATAGSASLEALALAGGENLDGKILVDVANPLDFSNGMPPTLTVCNDDSLAEQIQRTFPSTRVVKTLNIVNAAVMVRPALVGDIDMFLCGNDADAKAAVESVLRDWFGWRSIVDLGDITGARAMEMYLPLWVRLMSSLGTPMFSIKVVH